MTAMTRWVLNRRHPARQCSHDSGGTRECSRGFAAWIGAAMLCAVSAQVPAQQMPPQPAPVFQYQPTVQDVDPGIDHGNSDATLPDEFKKQQVFYRSLQPPGTIIIDTQERHLYLIESPTTRYATASASAATVSPGRACCRSPANPSGRTGIRRRR